MSTVHNIFFVNLYDFLRAVDRQCRARRRKRRVRTLAAADAEGGYSDAEMACESVSGSRVVVPESLLTPLPRHVTG